MITKNLSCVAKVCEGIHDVLSKVLSSQITLLVGTHVGEEEGARRSLTRRGGSERQMELQTKRKLRM